MSGPIGGKEQKSKYTIDCRYNPKKIITKMLECRKLLKNRLTIYNKDFSNLSELNDEEVCLYLDPPYYVQGKNLYPIFMEDSEHLQLANILSSRKKWVLSYDDCPEIRQMYNFANIIDVNTDYCINGKKQNWANKNELLILPKE